MKILLGVILVVLFVVGAFVWDTYRDAGEFKDLEPHFDGEIRKISGVIGVDHSSRNRRGVSLL